MLSPPRAADEVSFGPFVLIPSERLLLRDGRPVHMGQRAFTLLVALARHGGEVVSKDVLLKEAWPDVQVDETSLRAQILALRRVLGDGSDASRYIVTVTGRGYCFSVPVTQRPRRDDGSAQAFSRPSGSLPLRLVPVIGRAESVAAIAEQLRMRRFVTIIGAGGIGKTTVAISVAEQVKGEYEHPPIFVDLGVLTDETLVSHRIAAALNLSGEDPMASITAALKNRQVLVVLDSCEPVVGSAAAAAEALLKASWQIHVLATSREALRAEGEWTYRLAPMEIPPPGTDLPAAAALTFSAVRLFVERAKAAHNDFDLTDADAPLAAEISRQLDGIPLAIELAATRVGQLGLRGLADRLSDRFALLVSGRRTALPRHQTLRATVDWSYGLLTTEEQRLLQRLAVFPGWFALDAAVRISTEEGAADAGTVERLAGLIDKSLLVAEMRDGRPAYRFLDTTRAYMREKLLESGQADAVAASHAAHFRVFFQAAEESWTNLPTAESIRRMSPYLDDLRAALDWSLGTTGKPENFMDLTIAAVPLWVSLGLVTEGQQRIEEAISVFERTPGVDPRLGMRLYAAVGVITLYNATVSPAAWRRTLELAEQLGDVDHQLRALNGLMVDAQRSDHREALSFALRFRDVARLSADRDDEAVAERVVGWMLHVMGDQAEAERLTTDMLTRYVRRRVPAHQTRMNYFDQRVVGLGTLARIAWLRGFPDRALRLADEAIVEAKAAGHPFSLFFAAAHSAAPIAFLVADPVRTAVAIEILLRTELWQAITWRSWTESLVALQKLHEGNTVAGIAMMQAALGKMVPGSYNSRLGILRTGLAEALSSIGRHNEALDVVDDALAQARGIRELWFEPEFLRIRGEILIACASPDAMVKAEALFEEAIRIAAGQSALSWELRGTVSLARLWRSTGQEGAARERLARILGRFEEGHATADLVYGATLLRELGGQP